MKRLIAFSSVAHMGFVMLGISTLTDFGINAAIFGMVAHGLITGMLFFIAGSVKDRYHTLEISRLGGMLIQAPRLGWILGFTSMASLGCPVSPASGVSSRRSCRPISPPMVSPSRHSAATWSSLPSVRCSPPATSCGCSSDCDGRAVGGVRQRSRDRRCHAARVGVVDTFLFLIVLFGVAPGLIFEVTDPAVVESLNNCLQFENGCDGVADATTAALGG